METLNATNIGGYYCSDSVMNGQLRRTLSTPNVSRMDNRAYLESNKLMDWLKVGTLQDSVSRHPRLTVASMNLLDPVVAYLSFNPLVRDTQARYGKIAHEFSASQVQLLACQEANSVSAQFLTDVGYQVVGLDINDGVKPEIEYMANSPSHKPWIEWGLIKRAWTGVQVCFNPDLYRVSCAQKPEFHIYPSEFQKNWKHAMFAAAHLILQAFKNPCSRTSWLMAAEHLYESLSGPMRTDGLLVTHLENKLTRESMIFCATHIESFDRNIAAGQLDMLCRKVQQLRCEFPDKTIVIAADFNWQVGAGGSRADLAYESIASLFKRRLGAVTMPIEDIQPTLVGKKKAVDGVFFITPEGAPAGHVRGVSLWPGAQDDPSLELSDHHSVVGQLLY